MEVSPLPQLTADAVYLSDGGLETTLVFRDGIDLPDFAAFPLLDSDDGRSRIAGYFTPYFDVAEAAGTGFVLDTPTWRANRDWGRRLGYDDTALAEANRRSVDYIAELAGTRPAVPTVLNGVIGPRGDGYTLGELMTPDEAADYHALQVAAFAAGGVQMLSALTMTYAAEAIGVVRAANADGVPAVISFTVETDGRLPSGQALGEAVVEVDDATDGAAAYFMVNCAHPTHFLSVLDGGGAWLERLKGVRANSSTKSHAELDEATELDRGYVPGLARHYGELHQVLPDLRVAGGCCGTDDAHVAAIARELVGS
ncbi:MAG: Homocysteine S-methyltransferase [Marmoricola sp.]|nr:Homocysteine S-methyltransferase [Marmoricola sp.]